MHVPGADRTKLHGVVDSSDCEDYQHRLSRSHPAYSKVALLLLRVQHIRSNQQVVLLQEVFDLFGAKPVFLAMPPIPLIPFKARERQFHYRESIYIIIYK